MVELIRGRRSIRKYSGRQVEGNKIEVIKEVALRSPSSKNVNPWEFIFIDDTGIVKKLKDCKPHGVKPLETAPLAVVVCADETKTDVWVEDCSIAAILVQMAAQSLELGSCWVQVRNRNYSENIPSEKYIQQLLKMPGNLRILCIITIGYPEKARKPKGFNELQFEKIRLNGY